MHFFIRSSATRSHHLFPRLSCLAWKNHETSTMADIIGYWLYLQNDLELDLPPTAATPPLPNAYVRHTAIVVTIPVFHYFALPSTTRPNTNIFDSSISTSWLSSNSTSAPTSQLLTACDNIREGISPVSGWLVSAIGSVLYIQRPKQNNNNVFVTFAPVSPSILLVASVAKKDVYIRQSYERLRRRDWKTECRSGE